MGGCIFGKGSRDENRRRDEELQSVYDLYFYKNVSNVTT